MICQCVPAALFVVHMHAPHLWRAASLLRILVAPPSVGYGTPAMAEAVAELINTRKVSLIAMGGHEDGVIAWSGTMEVLGPLMWEKLDLVDNAEAT